MCVTQMYVVGAVHHKASSLAGIAGLWNMYVK